MTGYNFNDIKTNNRFEIIQKIYQGVDINRNYITQVTGLTNAAITKIINSLIAEKYISEKNYFSNLRNRKARYLSICEGSSGVIVLNFGRSMIKAAIADICGKVIYSQQYSVSYLQIDEVFFNEIVGETVKKFPAKLSCIGCIVVSPGIGLIDETEKINNNYHTPYFWNFKKLHDIMKKKYHIPLFNDNASNALLLGEKWFGKGRDTDNFVVYNIGKGIGSAVCINGKLLRRYHNSAIEVGHVTINFEGPDCDCGNKGCLELYASTDRWEQKLEQLGAYPEQRNKMEAMFANALREDKASLDLLNQYTQIVAVGAITLVSMFSPEKIILTTNEADYMYLSPFIKTITEQLEERSYSTRKEKILVEGSELRESAVVLGGIAIALEKKLLAQ
jgi:predicted NBD/HSP70 family sugar kinase